jgi:hypothetical protein
MQPENKAAAWRMPAGGSHSKLGGKFDVFRAKARAERPTARQTGKAYA